MNRKIKFISMIAIFLFAFAFAFVFVNSFGAKEIKAAKTTITVTYDPNGGELGNVPETQTATTNSSTVTIRLNSNKPTRENSYSINGCTKTTTKYTFSKWNTNASGTGTNYNAGGSISRYRVNKGDLTLYAKWTTSSSYSYVCSYRLTYDANGGDESQLPADSVSANQSATTKSFSVSTRTITRDPDYIGCHKIIYTFKGWSTSKDVYEAVSSVKLTGVGGEEVVGTVYAYYDQEDIGLCSYGIIFDPNHDGDTETREEDKFLTSDSKTYIARDLDVIKDANVELCTQYNHRFLGWALDADAVTPLYAVNDEIVIEGLPNEVASLTLYAVWSDDPVGLCNYKVTYMVDDEQVDYQEALGVLTSDKTFALSSYLPFKEGYMFVGWDYDEGVTNPLFTDDYGIVYLEYQDNYDVEMVLYPIYKQFDNVLKEMITDSAIIKTDAEDKFAPGYNFAENMEEMNKIKKSGYDLLQWVSVGYDSLNIEFVSEETFLGYGYTEVNINSSEFNNVIQSALGQAGERQVVYRFCSSTSGLCTPVAATQAISADIIDNMSYGESYDESIATISPVKVLMVETPKTSKYSFVFVVLAILSAIVAAGWVILIPSKRKVK